MVEVLLGLAGMRVLGVAEGDDEVVIEVETTASMGWCRSCGVRAQAQDRTVKSVRDLSCFGRPVRLAICQRKWRCRESLCAVKTWTEDIDQIDATAVLTRRAGADRQLVRSAVPTIKAVPRTIVTVFFEGADSRCQKLGRAPPSEYSAIFTGSSDLRVV